MHVGKKAQIKFFFISATNFESNQVETAAGGDWADTWLHEAPRRHAKLENKDNSIPQPGCLAQAKPLDFQIIVI